jgi:hypothetical protein
LTAIWVWAFIRRVHSSRAIEQLLSIKADANRYRTMTADKAKALLLVIDKQIEDYHTEVGQVDEQDNVTEDLIGQEINNDKLPAPLADLQTRRDEILAMQKTCQEADEHRKKQGIDPKKNPFQLPINDTDSRILPNKEGGYAPNYTPLVAVESELGLIIHTHIFNSTQEHDHLVNMVETIEQTYDAKILTLAADAAYSTGHNISELEYKRGIDFVSPHRGGDAATDNPAIREDLTQPVIGEEVKKLPLSPRGTFSNEAFVYDEANDRYVCPNGKEMPRAYAEKVTHGNGETVERVVYQCSQERSAGNAGRL